MKGMGEGMRTKPSEASKEGRASAPLPNGHRRRTGCQTLRKIADAFDAELENFEHNVIAI
jgi:hypothetical protein